jgi:hypothetical protein
MTSPSGLKCPKAETALFVGVLVAGFDEEAFELRWK